MFLPITGIHRQIQERLIWLLHFKTPKVVDNSPLQIPGFLGQLCPLQARNLDRLAQQASTPTFPFRLAGKHWYARPEWPGNCLGVTNKFVPQHCLIGAFLFGEAPLFCFYRETKRNRCHLWGSPHFETTPHGPSRNGGTGACSPMVSFFKRAHKYCGWTKSCTT